MMGRRWHILVWVGLALAVVAMTLPYRDSFYPVMVPPQTAAGHAHGHP